MCHVFIVIQSLDMKKKMGKKKIFFPVFVGITEKDINKNKNQNAKKKKSNRKRRSRM